MKTDQIMYAIVDACDLGLGAPIPPCPALTKLIKRGWVELSQLAPAENPNNYDCYNWTEKGAAEWGPNNPSKTGIRRRDT